MEEKKVALLETVKKAVSLFGISAVSTRNVGENAKVNDLHIYRFFKDKEDLLLQVYEKENGFIFRTIIGEIDKAKEYDSLREKMKHIFQNV